MTNIDKLLDDLTNPPKMISRDIGHGVIVHESIQSEETLNAYSESERISDPILSDKLKDLIIREKKEDKKLAAIRMLGNLSRNINTDDSLIFFKGLLSKTKNKREIYYLLEAISKKDYKNEDFNFLFDFISKKNIDNTYNALKALIRFDNFRDESYIIRIISDTSNDQIKEISCEVLSSIGGHASIELLIREFNKSRNNSLRLRIYTSLQLLNHKTDNRNLQEFIREKEKLILPAHKIISIDSISEEFLNFFQKEESKIHHLRIKLSEDFNGIVNLNKSKSHISFIHFGFHNSQYDIYKEINNQFPSIAYDLTIESPLVKEKIDKVISKILEFFNSDFQRFYEFWKTCKYESLSKDIDLLVRNTNLPLNESLVNLYLGLLKTELKNEQLFINDVVKHILMSKNYVNYLRYVKSK